MIFLTLLELGNEVTMVSLFKKKKRKFYSPFYIKVNYSQLTFPCIVLSRKSFFLHFHLMVHIIERTRDANLIFPNVTHGRANESKSKLIAAAHTSSGPYINQWREISKYLGSQVLQSMKHLVSNNWPVTPHYSMEKLKTILNDQDTFKSTSWLSLHKTGAVSLQEGH